jgi:Tol biopolymer transport system component
MMRLLSMVIAATLAASPALPVPQAFEPQLLGDTALSPAFSPDGQTMLFTRQVDRTVIIMESHRTANGWSQPQPAAFSGGKYADTDPAFGPDGAYVVFASARPTGDAQGKTLNLWLVKRNGTTWGTPVHLPPAVNVSAFAFAPSVARDGTIYFMASYRVGNTKTSQHQLYRARLQGDAYQQAEPLSFSSPATADADPLVAPDQSFVLFVSAGRAGASDTNQYLYIARASGSSWGPVQPIAYKGEYDGDSDCCLTFGPDGKTILFTAGRGNESAVMSIPAP